MILNHRTCQKPLPCDNTFVEIGFGRGDFLISLAKKQKNNQIIGFEISGISVEKAEKRIRRLGITNVLLIQMDAFWGFHFLLKRQSVRDIFINFPDPWFKKRHFKRRLTSPERLSIFASRLKRGGTIRIKSDYKPFIDYTVRSAEELGIFRIKEAHRTSPNPLTKYEEKALSRGGKVYEIILELIEHPAFREPEIKEAIDMFRVRKKGKLLQDIAKNQEVKVMDGTVLKTFKVFGCGDRKLIECLISERGFTQRFLLEVKEHGEFSEIDISPFSEVIRTEGIRKAVEKVSELWIRP